MSPRSEYTCPTCEDCGPDKILMIGYVGSDGKVRCLKHHLDHKAKEEKKND